MSSFRRNLTWTWLCLVLPAAAAAQDAAVTGSVRTRTGEPVRGAFVVIVALGLGTVTNDAGAYRLLVPAARATGSVTLQAQSIGYRSSEVEVRLAPGAVVRQDITLSEQAIALEQVVVTGTAGRLERRAQAAVVEKLDAARVTEVAPVNSVPTLLQARVAGVHLRVPARSGRRPGSGSAARPRSRSRTSRWCSSTASAWTRGHRRFTACWGSRSAG
jgi:hypothetical protein